MSNKQELIISAIKEIADFNRSLEHEKQIFKDNIESRIDLLVSQCAEPITDDEKKAFKKIAKALADDKVDSVSKEATLLAELVSNFVTN